MQEAPIEKGLTTQNVSVSPSVRSGTVCSYFAPSASRSLTPKAVRAQLRQNLSSTEHLESEALLHRIRHALQMPIDPCLAQQSQTQDEGLQKDQEAFGRRRSLQVLRPGRDVQLPGGCDPELTRGIRTRRFQEASPPRPRQPTVRTSRSSHLVPEKKRFHLVERSPRHPASTCHSRLCWMAIYRQPNPRS